MRCASGAPAPAFQNNVEYREARARVKSQNGDRGAESFIEPINETLGWMFYGYRRTAKTHYRRHAESAENNKAQSLRIFGRRDGASLMFEAAD
jgi:hypothetical protein